MKTYAPHEQRVIDEKAKCDDDRTKLLAFIQTSPIFGKMEATDQALMTEQWEVMTHLSVILGARIERF